MTQLFTEIRYAARRLAGSPGYSLGVFLTLALGLALSVGMYTVLEGVVLKGLPYPGGERVVEISAYNAAQDATNAQLTPAEALALEDAPVFEHAGWFMWGGETVLSGERPREIVVHRVSPGYFPALGVRPQIGRWIDAGDAGPDGRAVVLSDAEWERLANRDPQIIGQSIRLADEVATVVGVMPPDIDTGAGLWLPANPEWFSDDPGTLVDGRYLGAIGLLAEGLDAAAAARGLDALAARIRDTHDLRDEGWRLEATSLLDLAIGDVRAVLAGVFVVSLVVLAIACANVGSLLAARLAMRERELAITQALGATSAHVWRSVLFELLLLALLGGVAALLVLTAGMEVFRTLSAGILPRADEVMLDPTAAVAAGGLALLCVLAVAVPFGLRLRQRMAGNLQASDKGTGSVSRGSMRALPVAGLALATAALIAGAGVALSLERLRAVDPGFRTADVYVVRVFHGGDADEWRRFAGAVLARIASEPNVLHAAATTAPPLAQIGIHRIDVQVPGRERPDVLRAGLRRVTPGYLGALSQPLLFGRNFLATDDAAAPKVAIVNETFARRVFGGTDVVGRDIGLPLGEGTRAPYRIVGVAADIRNAGLRRPADPEILVPFMQEPWLGMSFLAHAPQAGGGLLERMQEAIWAVDPEEGMSRVYRLQDEIDAQLAQVMYFTRVLGVFALLALLMAAFGVYSVIAFLQRRQTAETGVRLALGAQPAGIARRVLGQGLALAVLASIAGSLGGMAVLRLLATQLFGVGASSPALYAVGVGGVLLAALLASVAPAWRAARVQPMAALRHE
jgi:putative ABC transport system permease protein